MTIATSITQSYLERSKLFFESVVANWSGPRICFTIGFAATIEGWTCVQVDALHDWRPKNRPGYYSLQHGEFTEYLSWVNADEMILFIDSDMVLQRPFDLDFPPTDKVLVTQCSWPALMLVEVAANLKCKRRGDKFCAKYNVASQKEFCACFIIAKFKTWQGIYKESVELYPLLKDFEHHAAWQLLINLAIGKVCRPILLPPHICNASWYKGTQAGGDPLAITVEADKAGELVTLSETVYFNHTKFSTYAT